MGQDEPLPFRFLVRHPALLQAEVLEHVKRGGEIVLNEGFYLLFGHVPMVCSKDNEE
jgi:hypothetical protein